MKCHGKLTQIKTINSMLLITSGQKLRVHNHKIEIFRIYLEKYDAFKKIRILN